MGEEYNRQDVESQLEEDRIDIEEVTAAIAKLNYIPLVNIHVIIHKKEASLIQNTTCLNNMSTCRQHLE